MEGFLFRIIIFSPCSISRGNSRGSNYEPSVTLISTNVNNHITVDRIERRVPFTLPRIQRRDRAHLLTGASLCCSFRCNPPADEDRFVIPLALQSLPQFDRVRVSQYALADHESSYGHAISIDSRCQVAVSQRGHRLTLTLHYWPTPIVSHGGRET